MAANELDAFLKGPEPETPEPSAIAPEPEPAEPKGAAPPEVQPPAQVKAEPDADEDAEPPEPAPGEPAIPRGAFDAMRKERHDWKAKAIQEETRRAELEKQLEEAKRATAAPPSSQPQYQPQRPPNPMPNPAIDPEGFAVWLDERQMHQRAHISEMQLRRELGSDKVDALLVEWQQATARDPSLIQQVAMQNDPYGWAHKKLETLRLQNEIGDDPAAYEAKLYAKWEAERAASGNGATAPRVSPAAGMQPSLAGARSVAARSAPAFTGPLSLDDILAPVNRAGRTARH